jgi:hypothetical protein
MMEKNGGKLLEKIIGGFPEAEYNAMKERQNKNTSETKDEAKAVVSFGWKHP